MPLGSPLLHLQLGVVQSLLDEDKTLAKSCPAARLCIFKPVNLR